MTRVSFIHLILNFIFFLLSSLNDDATMTLYHLTDKTWNLRKKVLFLKFKQTAKYPVSHAMPRSAPPDDNVLDAIESKLAMIKGSTSSSLLSSLILSRRKRVIRRGAKKTKSNDLKSIETRWKTALEAHFGTDLLLADGIGYRCCRSIQEMMFGNDSRHHYAWDEFHKEYGDDCVMVSTRALHDAGFVMNHGDRWKVQCGCMHIGTTAARTLSGTLLLLPTDAINCFIAWKASRTMLLAIASLPLSTAFLS